MTMTMTNHWQWQRSSELLRAPSSPTTQSQRPSPGHKPNDLCINVTVKMSLKKNTFFSSGTLQSSGRCRCPRCWSATCSASSCSRARSTSPLPRGTPWGWSSSSSPGSALLSCLDYDHHPAKAKMRFGSTILVQIKIVICRPWTQQPLKRRFRLLWNLWSLPLPCSGPQTWWLSHSLFFTQVILMWLQ